MQVNWLMDRSADDLLYTLPLLSIATVIEIKESKSIEAVLLMYLNRCLHSPECPEAVSQWILGSFITSQILK